ncbi:Vomp family autotransporter [Bartonella sp. B41]
MKKTHLVLKENNLKDYHFFRSSQAVLLDTTLIVFLSSIFPSFAADPVPTEVASTSSAEIESTSTAFPSARIFTGQGVGAIIKDSKDKSSKVKAAKKSNSLILGNDPYDIGDFSVSIGAQTFAVPLFASNPNTGSFSVSIGANTITAGIGTIGIGASSQVFGSDSIGIGKFINVGTAAGPGGENLPLGVSGVVAIGSDLSIRKSSNFSIAIGKKVTVYDSAESAIAIGFETHTDHADTVVVGHGGQAIGTASIAVGLWSNAGGDSSVALGDHAITMDNRSIAMGSFASAQKGNSIAIGQGASSANVGSISVGSNANATGHDAVSLGNESKSTAYYTVAIGWKASSSLESAVAIGFKAKASAFDSVALGSDSVVNDSGDAGSLGYNPITGKLTSMDSHDFNDHVWISTRGAVSVGNVGKGFTRQIKSVAAGSEDTDAVNIAQLKKLKEYATSGWKAVINGDTINPIAFGKDSGLNFSVLNKNLKIAKGDSKSNIAFGLSDNIILKSVKTGGNSLTETGLNVGSVHITSTGIDSGDKKIIGVLDGELSSFSKEAVSGSQLYSVSNMLASYFGGGAQYDGGKWTAPTFKVNTIGTDGTHKEESYNNVAAAFAGISASFGNIDKKISNKFNEFSSEVGIVSGDNLVQQNGETRVISIGGTKGGSVINATNSEGEARVILGVKNGVISSSSKEAVNGSQLYSVGNMLASYFGGGAQYDSGKWTAPTFKLVTVSASGNEEKGYNDVATAFTGVSSSFTNIDKKINQLSKEINNVTSDGIISHDTSTNVIFIGRREGGSVINVTNSEGEARIISGIKGGTISSSSKEAINGSQLYSVSNTLASYFGGGAQYDGGKWTSPTFKLTAIGDDGVNKNESYANVAAAFTGVGSSFTNLDKKISNEVKVLSDKINIVSGGNLVQQNKDTHVISIGVTEGGGIIDVTNNAGEVRVISGVKSGTISSVSKEAINGSQFYSMSNTLVSYFGGEAKYDGGKWTAPTFKLTIIGADGANKEESYANVAAAFTGIGTSFANLDKKISDRVEKLSDEINIFTGSNLVQQNKDTHAILIGGNESGHTVDITNSEHETRIISGVKSGATSSSSKEAVNGSQLYSTNTTLVSYFGGGAQYNGDKWMAPTFKLVTVSASGSNEEKSYNDVAAAFTGVGSSFTNLDKKLNKISDQINDNSIVGYDTSTNVISIGSGKGGSTISIVNNEHETRIISGVKNGAISSESKEAVNGSQLYSMNTTLAAYFGGGASYNDGVWTVPNFQIAHINDDGSIVTEKKYNNVASALSDVSKSILNVNNRLSEIKNNVSSDSVLVWDNEKEAYDASREGQRSKITNVANGTVAQNSTDVVNGGQLWNTDKSVTDVEKRVSHVEKNVDDLSNTVTDMDDVLVGIEKKVDGITDGVVTYNRDQNGKKTNKIALSGGDESEPVLIDNLADGHIASKSKEAINGGQLYDYTEKRMNTVFEDAKQYTDQRVSNITVDAIDEAFEQSKKYTDLKFENLNYSIEGSRKEARQAAAIGLAVANLHYNDSPGKLSISFGGGLWRSQTALAFGAGYTSESGNIRSSLSVTSSGGHWGVGGAFNVTLN